MANSKIKKNIDKKDEVEDKSKKVKTHPLIKSPRITEKSAKDAERGIYTFNVMLEANKNEIKKAIKLIYEVTPTSVSITKIAKKTVTRRGIVGIKSGGKKAVVHLKKGDKITFV